MTETKCRRTRVSGGAAGAAVLGGALLAMAALALPGAARSAAGSDCVGDCDGNGEVTVNELVAMVNIALGNIDLSSCAAGDAGGSGDVEVAEIVQAVNNALGGCTGGAAATPTAPPSSPTRTATPASTPTSRPTTSVSAKYAGHGPYVVGMTTLDLGDRSMEVWYPVDPGTEAGREKASYAAFTVLPEEIQQILPPDLNVVVAIDAYRDLQVSRRGPFPILTFSHGAGGFRQAYSGFLAGVASHGIVVASLDHVEWGLLAQVGLRPPGEDRDPGEVVLAAVSRLAAASADPQSPLTGGVDSSRVATSGHSAGGRAAFALPDRPEVKAMIGFATGNSSSGVSGKPVLLLAGAEDGGAGALERAYDDLSPIKRFVAVGRAGHNSFTDQCAVIHGGNNFLGRLVEAGFPIPPDLVEAALDGCRPENLAPADFWKAAQHFTVAHLRAAFGIDVPPMGLGGDVVAAFGDIGVRYRFADDPLAPPTDTRGFVVSGFHTVVATHGGDPCPGGFNLSPEEHVPPLVEDCQNPQATADPLFKTISIAGTADALDLDGRDSRKDAPAPGECAHDDFAGPGGTPGVDLAVWRAVGCVRGFQAGEIADVVVDQAARDGSMTILVELRGVDDLRNDDEVRVQVFGSTDAPPVGADGNVLPFGTLGVHGDARYRGTVGTGRIVDGVLLAGPLDIRVRINIQIVAGDLTFRHARLRLGLRPDGTAAGEVYGFQPVEEFYGIFGRSAGAAGAGALGYTCSGLYSALAAQADGDYDAGSGRCTSISTGYRFEAVPAFIVK